MNMCRAGWLTALVGLDAGGSPGPVRGRCSCAGVSSVKVHVQVEKHFRCPSSFPIHSLPFASDTHPAKPVRSLPLSLPARLLISGCHKRAVSRSRALCPPSAPPLPGKAGSGPVSIRIGHRNQHIPVMLIYRPLGCQHKYLINTDMNNTG